ncbi:distal tail protein Dit, partial [Lactococcus lactis]|uniref:distal tail protein Dit n=1 Tax=Lactococcus lactis TaxID=1358 RepID=UPI00223C2287
MAFSVNFNGIDLSTIIDGFTAITRNVGSGWTNNVQSNPFIGSDFISNSINSKSITVNFIVNVQKDRFSSVRKSLASALNVTEPAPLIFDDDPNKLWLAVPDGAPTLDESSFYQGIGSITFLVPSGIALSSYTQELNSSNSGDANGSITVNSDNSVDILINNQGTIPAYPTFKFTHKSDNAFIGLAGQ